MPVSVPVPPQALARHGKLPLPAPSPPPLPGAALSPGADAPAPDADLRWPDLSPPPFVPGLDADACAWAPEPLAFATPPAPAPAPPVVVAKSEDRQPPPEPPALPVFGDPAAADDAHLRVGSPCFGGAFEPVFAEPFCPPGIDFAPEYFDAADAPRFL